MSTMRTDMGGAAMLTGALGLAIAQGLQKRVKLYLCCAENMVSHNAFKLGDIITYRNGVTAEVLNTDAEGRLVLADGLIEASKQNAQLILFKQKIENGYQVELPDQWMKTGFQHYSLPQKIKMNLSGVCHLSRSIVHKLAQTLRILLTLVLCLLERVQAQLVHFSLILWKIINKIGYILMLPLHSVRQQVIYGQRVQQGLV